MLGVCCRQLPWYPRRKAAALALFTAFGAFGGPTSHLEAQTMDETRIRERRIQFEEAWNRGDAESLVRVFADPYVDVNSPVPVVGRAQMAAGLAAFFGGFASTLRITSHQLIIVGDIAVQRGEFVQTITPKQGGATTTVTRRYVEVYRRQADGAWLVAWGIDAPIKGSQ